jgi:DnaK suppressor protein
MFANIDLMQIRTILEGERVRLLQSLDDGDHQQLWMENPNDEDLADLMADQTRRASIGEFNNRVLEQIDRALERLEMGMFGVCAKCGEDIPAARLEALPYAELCVECQAKTERKRFNVRWKTL